MINVLAIDGGGVRGIIPATILLTFEQQLKTITKNPNASISDYFDIIAGTSTGGILSLIYLTPDKFRRPLYTAKDALDLYINNSDKIFRKSLTNNITSCFGLFGAKYSSKNLKNLALEYFTDTRISNLLKPSLITSYDLKNNTPIYFSKCNMGASICKDFYARDVALATSSAPTYFNAAKISSVFNEEFTLIDGGVFANNPSLCALTECFEISGDIRLSEIKILSLGTGTKDLSKDNYIGKKQGYLFWGENIINVIMNGTQQTCDKQLFEMFSSVNLSDNYLRIDVDSSKLKKSLPKIDSCKKSDINYLHSLGNIISESYLVKIQNFIQNV